MTLKQRQEAEPSPRLRPEGSCPSFPCELWHTVHVVPKASVKRFIANMFLHGRTLRVPGCKGLAEEGDVGVEHPLLSSPSLSLSSGDPAPKLRVTRSLCRGELVPSEGPSVRLQGRWRKEPVPCSTPALPGVRRSPRHRLARASCGQGAAGTGPAWVCASQPPSA